MFSLSYAEFSELHVCLQLQKKRRNPRSPKRRKSMPLMVVWTCSEVEEVVEEGIIKHNEFC